MPSDSHPFDVAVVDPYPLYRAGIEGVCERSPSLRVVASCGTADEGLAAIRTKQPDVAVVDPALPDMRGIVILRAAASAGLSTRILVVTAERDGGAVYEALASGAVGYVLKTVVDEASLSAAIVSAAAGDTVISAELHRFIASEIRLQACRNSVGLTSREREILSLVAAGCSAREIGQRLVVSHSTVKTHLRNVYEKLGVSDRAAAVAQGIKNGLVESV